MSNTFYKQALALETNHRTQNEKVQQNQIKQQEEFNEDLDYVRPKHSFAKTVAARIHSLDAGRCVKELFPVLDWLPRYSPKDDFVGDLISGMTVAIMHIPQGIAYALLAQIPPVIGIYVAFFPVLVYFIFGTSRHNSMGTFAVVCLMVGQSVLRLAPHAVESRNSTLLDTGLTEGAHSEPAPAEIATALCFVVGCWQLVLYALRLGIASSLLSETLVSGFTTGAAVHVFTSQIKSLLGLKLKPVTGHFEVIFVSIKCELHAEKTKRNGASKWAHS